MKAVVNRLSLLLVLLLSSVAVMAQKMTVESFEFLPNDITARAKPKLDINGNNCAVVKVSLPLKDVVFDDGVIDVEYKTGEYWVYMGERSPRLQIKHDNYHPLYINFADYGIKRVESNATYRLVVLLPQASASAQTVTSDKGIASADKKKTVADKGDESSAKKKVAADKGNESSKRKESSKSSGSVATGTTGTHCGHEWVDLGLPSGTKWATTNVGASSPADYGDYFAWGETNTKSSYELSNLKYYDRNDPSGKNFSKYISESEIEDVDVVEKMIISYSIDNIEKPTEHSLDYNLKYASELDFSDDAAYVNWGKGWQIPSIEQMEELEMICQWVWTSANGHDGYKVIGPNGNFIFLPAAGGQSQDCKPNSTEPFGHYWTDKLATFRGDDSYALMLDFSTNNKSISHCYRYLGLTIRPVLAP